MILHDGATAISYTSGRKRGYIVMIGSMLSKAGRKAVDLLFPPRCAICGRAGAFICDDCRESLPKAERPRCPACWQGGSLGICRKCEESPPAFQGLRSPYVFEGGVRGLVHGLKYRQQTALAGPMAELLFDFVRREPHPMDVLVPVPLFGRRERTRGYNQSALLARSLARRLGLGVEERSLVRARNTASQAQSGSAQERHVNVRDAFLCKDGRLAGKHVLLIDDVSTTGATLDACAKALVQGGAASVWALTFARED